MSSQTNITILCVGILTLLGVIVVGDFYLAHRDSREPDDNVITLLKMSIVGLTSVLSAFFATEAKR